MNPLLHDLMESLRLPQERDDFPSPLLHSSLGPSVRLPDDYCEFMTMYGPGVIVDNQKNPLELYDLVGVGDVARTRDRIDTHRYTYPIVGIERGFYPETDGLLPWGGDDQGSTFFWTTSGCPNVWRVAVDDHAYVTDLDCSFLEFLWGSLYRRGEFGRYVIAGGEGRELAYCPLSRYLDFCYGKFDPFSEVH